MAMKQSASYIDEYHIVRTILITVLCISLASIFIAYTTQQDTGIACTPNHQTAACSFKSIETNINTTFTNLINSPNNATTTPLKPLNASADLGLGGIANLFIAIPNILAHVFGYWNSNINPVTQIAFGASGFLLSLLALLFELGSFILFTLFIFTPSILASLSVGVFAPLLALIEIITTGIFIVLALIILITRIQGFFG